MSLSVGQYWPLSLLLIVPVLWWIQGRSFAGFGVKQRALQTTVRSAVVLLLMAALMEPVLVRTGGWLSTVYLVDVSASVSLASRAFTAQWIAEANAYGSPDHWAVMEFASDAVALDDVDALRETADDPAREGTNEASLDRGVTNLERSVAEARRQFAPNHNKRLVLMTDGRQNVGNMVDALADLQRDGVQVFTMPVAARDVGDAWVDSVVVPDIVTVDEPFPLEVELYSQATRTAVIEVSRNGSTLDARTVRLESGLTRVVLEGRLDGVGPAAVDVRLIVGDDPIVENNHIRSSTFAVERPRVLYVEGHSESRRFLHDALATGGLTVEGTEPGELPGSVAGLEPYAAVVFSDVAPEALNDAQMSALESYVSELGGGFVMAGGDEMYGEDGYADTAIEALLPVTFSVKERPEQFALIIVLDKSWSMVGQKIELSKEASKAAVDVLADHHEIGVVAFNNSLDWPVLLQRASNREWIKNKISTIMPSGHTNIYPALEEAYLGLLNATGRLRHIILLSDGRTYPDDYEGLVTKMADAGITVSTVAMGDEADHELLANIADWGNGRGYMVQDAAEVPQIFAKETQRAARPTLVEAPFNPILRKAAEMFKGIDFSTSPPLQGYVSTQLKDTSEALLVSEEDDPILARWQFGLGTAVAFTSDVKNRWATEWLSWPGYGKFWTQLVRETMRGPDDRVRALHVDRERDRARITVDLAAQEKAAPQPFRPHINIVGPDSLVATVEATRVGRGAYTAAFPLARRGDYAFSVASPDGAETRRALLYSYPDEYRLLPPDIELLQAISRDTGGAFEPTLEQLFSEDGQTTRPIALWPFLAAAALVLYLLDLLLRRVRLFEPLAHL